MLAEEGLAALKQVVAQGQYLLSRHARFEAVAEDISETEIIQAIAEGTILEDYPEDERGASCLLVGHTGQGRPLHVVLTANRMPVIIVTVYEPSPPRWTTPWQRRRPQ